MAKKLLTDEFEDALFVDVDTVESINFKISLTILLILSTLATIVNILFVLVRVKFNEKM